MSRRLRLAAVAALALAACGSPPSPTGVAVVDVVDGDTFTARVDGVEEQVRIIGMNTPESGECLAEEATAELARLLATGAVELRPDVSDRDRNGRLLRYVEAGGVDVGEALVRAGLAVVRVSEPDVAREAALVDAQEAARTEGAGIWSPDACGPPAAGAGALVVGDLRLDADGPDEDNLDDEWAEIANTGTEPVDLSGWGLRDESASHRFAFPAGFVLAPGARVRVRSGCGEPTPTDLHWCVAGSAVWNNGGDTAFLLDPRGNVVSSLHK